MAYQKIPVQSGDVISSNWGNHIQTQYEEAKNDLDNHDANYVRHVGYGNASGTNDKSITLNPAPTSYVDGMAISFKNATQNTGAVTLNVNGLGAKSVLKPNGNALTSGNLKANSIYTVRYNASTENFILQGEGGSGNAQPADVLSGKTFTNDAGEQVGTMPNRGNVNQTLTQQGQEYTVPEGYHAGGGKVTANITNLTAGNVRYGATVGGVAGTFSQTANGATAAQILTGRQAAVNGSMVTGTMPNLGGNQPAQAVRARNNTILGLRPQNAGYYPAGTANWLEWEEPNWKPENIRDGVSMFGKVGTLAYMPVVTRPSTPTNFAHFTYLKGVDSQYQYHLMQSSETANNVRKYNLAGTQVFSATRNFDSTYSYVGYNAEGILESYSAGATTYAQWRNEAGTLLGSINVAAAGSPGSNFSQGAKSGDRIMVNYNSNGNTDFLFNTSGTLLHQGKTQGNFPSLALTDVKGDILVVGQSSTYYRRYPYNGNGPVANVSVSISAAVAGIRYA